MKRSPLRRSTIRRVSPMQRRRTKKLNEYEAELAPKRAVIVTYVCDLNCGRMATVPHHRKLRKHGGNNDWVNLSGLCMECHTKVHANPTVAYYCGLLVHSWEDPNEVTVRADLWNEHWTGMPLLFQEETA